jgi:lipoate---protein ligase
MHLVDLTLKTAAENVALDEALLEEAEVAGQPSEVLRLWESPQTAVVVGRSSKVTSEVNLDACRSLGVPVLRRASGGAAIVAGPGCLMYAVVLSYGLRPTLRSLDEAHGFVLSTMLAGLRTLAPGAQRQGTSDLTLGEYKFSGNAVRCKRGHLLYHGTLLYDFSLPLVSQFLGTAPRQPDYRAGRAHERFVINLPVSGAALRAAIIAAWRPEHERRDWPQERVRQLVEEKYNQEEWNFRT